MPKQGERKRRQFKRFNLLVVPEGESGQSRRYKLSIPGLFGAITGAIILTVTLTILALIYTPLHTFVSIPNPAMENKYLHEFIAVQEKLGQLTMDVGIIREYNQQLRRALGEGEDGTVEITESGEETDPADLSAWETDISDEFAFLNPNEEGIPQNQSVTAFRVVERQEAMFRPTLPVMLPVDGYITRGFEVERRHFGIDIAGKVGTPISAIADGMVIFSNWTYQDGYMVILSHSGGYISVYKHNKTNLVREGEFIKRGATIALLGNTGIQSYGPHLHFELWKEGTPVDPSGIFFFKEIL